MVKLKIGTVSKKKKEIEQSKMNDYFNDLTDEDLEDMQIEAEEIAEEDEEIIEEVDTTEVDEEIDEAEAVEGIIELSILDHIGINTKYANKFTELYPKKKIIYRNLITKQFLEWYIKNVKIQLLTSFKLDSEYINKDQYEKIEKLMTKRLNEDIEIDENIEETEEINEAEVEKEEIKEEINKIELESKEDSQMYELLLRERWKEDRAKGIHELDAIIEENMRITESDITQALYNIINMFHLDKKLKKLGKKEAKTTEKIAPKKPKKPLIDLDEKIVENVNFTTARENSKAIKYFHHITFLYDLMGEKMDFNTSLTDKEKKHITQIHSLINDRIEPKSSIDVARETYQSFDDFMGERKK